MKITLSIFIIMCIPMICTADAVFEGEKFICTNDTFSIYPINIHSSENDLEKGVFLNHTSYKKSCTLGDEKYSITISINSPPNCGPTPIKRITLESQESVLFEGFTFGYSCYGMGVSYNVSSLTIHKVEKGKHKIDLCVVEMQSHLEHCKEGFYIKDTDYGYFTPEKLYKSFKKPGKAKVWKMTEKLSEFYR